MVKKPIDGRKGMRFPIELYDQVIKVNPNRKKIDIISNVISEFNELYASKKTIAEKSELIHEHGLKAVETSPHKISFDDFEILKVVKFETNYSYTDIIASAMELYLEKQC